MNLFETLSNAMRPDLIEDAEIIEDIEYEEVLPCPTRVSEDQIERARQRMIEIHNS